MHAVLRYALAASNRHSEPFESHHACATSGMGSRICRLSMRDS